jgi:hypothetical protein
MSPLTPLPPGGNPLVPAVLDCTPVMGDGVGGLDNRTMGSDGLFLRQMWRVSGFDI